MIRVTIAVGKELLNGNVLLLPNVQATDYNYQECYSVHQFDVGHNIP